MSRIRDPVIFDPLDPEWKKIQIQDEHPEIRIPGSGWKKTNLG
jgi:hypothetical protein